MQRHVLRLARIRMQNVPGSLRSGRGFAASSNPRPTNSRHYIDALYRETRDPIWRLVDNLRTLEGRVDEADWKSIVSEQDLTSILASLEDQGYITKLSSNSHTKRIPTWVILHLVAYKVRTPTQASGPLLDIVFSYVDTQESATIQAPLLILAAFHLARFNLIIPLRRIIQSFLTSSFPHPEFYFNLFLQALSHVPYRTVDNANNVVSLLKAMEARQLKLRSQTYDALLNDRFVTLQLTKFLQARMVSEGFVPSQEQLEAYLRIFSKHGVIHDAQEYFQAIHSLRSDQAKEGEEGVSNNPYYRANTLLLNAYGDRGSAFNFLRNLNATKNGPRSAKAPQNQDVDSEAHEEYEHHVDTGTHASPHTRLPRFVRKPSHDIYDQTATLHVIAKDISISTSRLIRTFGSLPARPTAVTYTVLIRGLLLRKEWKKAEIYWGELVKKGKKEGKGKGLAVDKEALTTGVRALTRVGKPHIAFQILERYAKRPGGHPAECTISNTNPPSQEKDSESGLAPSPSVQITTIGFNEFLVALRRIARPDAVLTLFTQMHTLYGVSPNTHTLSILLQSSRLSHRMDDTLSGALARVGAKIGWANPFGRREPRLNQDQGVSEEERSRDEAVDKILTVLGHPSRGGLRKYRSGSYDGLTALEFARGVFLRCVWGTDPTGGEGLSALEAPARATRETYDSEPYLGPKAYVFHPPPGIDLLDPSNKPYYPTVLVTNANVFNYLALLGASGRYAGEIPLVLAWMRYLGIQPSESTLAVAMVLWAEVSVEAPLVERFRRGGSEGGERNVEGEERQWGVGGETLRFVEWLVEWVGTKRMPSERVLLKWRRIVQMMRESQEAGSVGGRDSDE